MNLGGGVHLTYCTNIHPGESWREVRSNLETHVAAVRARIQPERPFGVGLRLSAQAAAELSEPAAMADLGDLLRRHRLYVFTVNGFPYGAFHGGRVKEGVYLPDWRDPERLRYSNLLADLLAGLLPEAPAVDGTVSTVPGMFKPAFGGRRDVDAMVEHLLRHVAHLTALRERTGKVVKLALEPEPHCFLETVDETIAFFETELRSPAAVGRLKELTGLVPSRAAAALREHLGICLDLCHAAVEFEHPTQCIDRLRAAEIPVHKMQISAGLRLPVLDASALEALARFDDPVYLHQVVEQSADGLRRFVDLPEAFASLSVPRPAREWRVHFHVPVFLDRLPPFASTQDFIREALTSHRASPVSTHLEVETYTWDVLPEPYRRGGVDEAIARELAWVLAELGA